MSGLDCAFGSGVLIAPNKVLTNYHVWNNFIKGRTDLRLGIEFEALAGENKSRFIRLSKDPVLVLPKMDAAVLTLEKASKRRPITPVERAADGRAVVLIGYPVQPRSPITGVEKNTLESIYGQDLLWNIKRWSEGRIIRPKSGPSNNLFYPVPVHPDIHTGKIPALCHTASSRDGNSGGALIDKKTGEFLGLHFGGGYYEKQDINFSVPARDLIRALKAVK